MNRVNLRTHRWLVALMTFALVTIALQRPARTAGSTIHVTTTAQGIANDGQCSLQEAIYSANLNFGVAPSSFQPLEMFDTGCDQGTGDDVIELQAGATYTMTSVFDDPWNRMGPTATPIVLSNITIEGHGATLVRSNPARDFTGLPNFRAFAVAKRSFADPNDDLGVAGDGTGNLYLKNLHIKGFTAKGGNGRSGGGGGMGAGGAIYVRDGVLTVENSTFQNNGAGGGNGSGVTSDAAGGGGGGLGGNGGVTFALPFVGGGGGGGSRGNGGAAGYDTFAGGGGGGGGGTLTGGDHGFDERDPYAGMYGHGGGCGGNGGRTDIGIGSDDGEDGWCPGGGGGGGESYRPIVGFVGNGSGGKGAYGGGGGGAGYDLGSGGDGGFGGGGGGGSSYDSRLSGLGPSGGDGGFGGGGGAGHGGYISGGPGDGGSFAGNADVSHGGGGAGLGGAIFNHRSTVYVFNSTFTGNFAVRGGGGGGNSHGGRGLGGAIFSVDGSLTIVHATMAYNETNSEGAGVVYYHSTETNSGSFSIHNTIISNSYPAPVRECFYLAHDDDDLDEITVHGSGNLITANFGCPGNIADYPADPELGPLQINAPGNTPTMALSYTSPALNAGDDDPTVVAYTDQRGVARPQGSGFDIGAYEVLPDFMLPAIDPLQIVVKGSASTTATVTSVAGFSGLVTLAASGVPSGFTVSFGTNPVSVPADGSASSSLSVNLSPSVKAGTYSFDVSGTSGSVTHSITVNVTVVATIASVSSAVDSFGAAGCIDSAGVVNAFKAKLTVAQNLSDAGRNQPAANVLAALLYQIGAQTSKHIMASCIVDGQTIDPSDVLKTDVSALIQVFATAAPNPLIGNVVTSANAPVQGATVTLSGNSISAVSAVTDVTGFYYFPVTSGLKPGATFQVSVPLSTKKKGVSSLQFIWSGAETVLNNLVFN
jgi:hypothetical protein